MGLMAQERMGDMTTVASGAHAHPEVDTMQDILARVVDMQADMASALATLTENQRKMAETMTVMLDAIETLQTSTAELQASTGNLARTMALVQADVAMLVERDS